MMKRKKLKREKRSTTWAKVGFSSGKESFETAQRQRWIWMPLASFRFSPLNFSVECIPKDSIIT